MLCCGVAEGIRIGLNLDRMSNENVSNERFITLFSSLLKEGEVLIASSSTDVFLLLNQQHFGENIDERQNKKKALAVVECVKKVLPLSSCCSQKSQNALQNTGIKKGSLLD